MSCHLHLQVKENAKQETSMKQLASRAELHADFLLHLFTDPEDGRHVFLQNVS
jgi:hypothetical protein